MTTRIVSSTAALTLVFWSSEVRAETITCNYFGDAHWVHIEQPNVKQARTELSSPGTGHDDGTENQCRGVGSAWVDLYIIRSDGAIPVCW